MSKKVYCMAQFEPKKGREENLFRALQDLDALHQEDGCLQFVVTRHRISPFATGETLTIATHEIWPNNEVFEAHCQRKETVEFFERECVSNEGMVAKFNVCTYSDE